MRGEMLLLRELVSTSPVAATQDRKRKRNGISCAVCLNYSNDNAHLKQHMKSMHTPRKGGLRTDVFFS